MITLRDINGDNIYECLDLEVDENQRDFVALNAKSLAEARLFGEIARSFAIYSDETMVGFVMLDLDYFADGTKVCALWRLMIDKRYQGKGYGKAAMEVVLTYVNGVIKPNVFRTSVVPGNEAARRLYIGLGFVPNGEFEGGEEVLIWNV
jgi:diamine N-acetyltransferase